MDKPLIPKREFPIKKDFLIKNAVLLVLLLLAFVLLLKNLDLTQIQSLIEQQNPWIFFTAMAVLPAFGFPFSPFGLFAGASFGIGFSIVASSISIAVNISLCYLLAHKILRHFVAYFLSKLHYSIPQVNTQSEMGFTFAVRIAPGVPFFVQSYLLGLANVSFRVYFPVSWSVAMVYNIGFIIFGTSLFTGKTGPAIFSFLLIIFLIITAKLLRDRFAPVTKPESEQADTP